MGARLIGCHQKGTSWSPLALAVVQAGVGFPGAWLGAGPMAWLATTSAGGGAVALELVKAVGGIELLVGEVA